ncbi:MAG: DUF3108 domain-containing protein [Candidatus Latescibacteria bacterium]|nr:DUF3108 domain-containing protein [Candidatus Latescibacterota bacterium]NIM20900.1 DUF3108 domain-containing protein [Candidatus Latescibacterota bacterium]NIM65035.1 DUF3108 domain-containing protein [Candidatus Latescibacterota bacterium]NIO01550.1 DUF3108 domain-containing protein [Candidatus Latescibacterota bacterium]NIO28067.1 DUF3108 domain-containing protein [Candidatus Latescibacterota bacterium]
MNKRRYINHGLAFLLSLLIAGGVGVSHFADSSGQEETLMDQSQELDSLILAGDTLSGADSLHVIIENPTPQYISFGEGEKFVYSIQYGIISAGEATLEIRNIAYIDSVPCYHIISDARSNRVFSKFFKVRDRFESFMDTLSLTSLYYEKHLREGKYRKDEAVKFDQSAHKAIYKDRVVSIPPRTQDVLSALYYVRALPLELGQSFAVANHTNGKNYPLVVKVLRREQISVEAGTFDCIVVEPLLRSAGLFKHKGRLTVWLTDDKYRIPVLMQSKVVIGAISAVLKEYELANKVRYAEQVRGGGSFENKVDFD